MTSIHEDMYTRALDDHLPPTLTDGQLKDKMHIFYEAHRLVEEMRDYALVEGGRQKPGAEVYAPGMDEVLRYLAYELRTCQCESTRRVCEQVEEEARVRSIK